MQQVIDVADGAEEVYPQTVHHILGTFILLVVVALCALFFGGDIASVVVVPLHQEFHRTVCHALTVCFVQRHTCVDTYKGTLVTKFAIEQFIALHLVFRGHIHPVGTTGKAGSKEYHTHPYNYILYHIFSLD